MKKLKKLVGLILALAMVMGLCVTSFAANDDYTITIENSTDGYVYTAYQIFKGDLSDVYLYSVYTGTEAPTDGTQLYTYDGTTYTEATYSAGDTFYYVSGTVLSNISWGDNVSLSRTETDPDNQSQEYSIYSELAAIVDSTDSSYPFTDSNGSALTSAAEVAAVLADYQDNDTVVEKFAEVISKYITGSGTSSENNSPYTISNLKAGYYLVKTTVVPENGTHSNYILAVAGNITVDTKSETVTIDKAVGDENTSNDDSTEDYDVGDDVPFTLTATLPSDYADYDTYKLVFHDILSDGLTFNDGSVVVTVYANATDNEGTVVDPSCYTVATKCYHEADITSFAAGTTYYTLDNNVYTVVADTTNFDSNTTYYTACTFDVLISDTKSLNDSDETAITVTKDSTIVVTYTAKLKTNAASIENNDVYLEYTNSPYDNGTGTTTHDKTYVVTFTLNVDKTDGTNALAGAGFTLYKAEQVTVDDDTFKPAETTYYIISNNLMTQVDENETYDKDATYYVYTKVGDEVTGNNITKFEFSGLATGYYKLVETTTPSGYNTADDLYFTLEAETVEDSTDSSGVSVVSITVKDADGNVISSGNTATFTVDTTNKTINTTVVNNAGSSLPSTGGIGTTLFYIIGGVLIAGAAILLITRRRMRKA